MNKNQENKLRNYLTERQNDLTQTTSTFDNGFSEGWEACKRHIYKTFMLDDDLNEFTCCQNEVPEYILNDLGDENSCDYLKDE